MFTTRHPVLLAIVHPMQVEINPYITRTELAKYCREHGIAVQAYSPLGSGDSYSGRWAAGSCGGWRRSEGLLR